MTCYHRSRVSLGCTSTGAQSETSLTLSPSIADCLSIPSGYEPDERLILDTCRFESCLRRHFSNNNSAGLCESDWTELVLWFKATLLLFMLVSGNCDSWLNLPGLEPGANTKRVFVAGSIPASPTMFVLIIFGA